MSDAVLVGRLMYYGPEFGDSLSLLVGRVRELHGGKGMSDQDKTRVVGGPQSSPPVAANIGGGAQKSPDSGPIRTPQDPTIGPAAAAGTTPGNPAPSPSSRRTMVGVGATKGVDGSLFLGNAGVTP